MTIQVRKPAIQARRLATYKDTFGRIIAANGGWGVPDSGQPWTVGSATGMSADGLSGLMTVNANNTRRGIFSVTQLLDQHFLVAFSTDKLAVTDLLSPIMILRGLNVDNDQYQIALNLNTTQQIDITIAKRVAGAGTTLATATNVATHAAGAWYWIEAIATGANPTLIAASVWAFTSNRPTAWQVTTTDSTASALQVPLSVGLKFFGGAGITNFPVVCSYRSFLHLPQRVWMGFSA